MGRFSDQAEQNPSQGATYVQRASAIRREYPGGDSDSDDYRRPHRDQKPLIDEDTQIEVETP